MSVQLDQGGHSTLHGGHPAPVRGAAAGCRVGYQPLVLLLVAAAGGIVADRYAPLPAIAWWLAACALIGCWLLA